MPRLWTTTVEGHRQAVRTAILDATAAIVEREGLLSVTMSQVAEDAGVGRATLYKYFPDLEAILHAWHEREIARHLDHLVAIRDAATTTRERLDAVLEGYALSTYGSHEARDPTLVASLHRAGHVAAAEGELRRMIRELLVEAAHAGDVRVDVDPDELAAYCVNALGAARTLTSEAAVRRLVRVTTDALRLRARTDRATAARSRSRRRSSRS